MNFLSISTTYQLVNDFERTDAPLYAYWYVYPHRKLHTVPGVHEIHVPYLRKLQLLCGS